MDYRHYPVIVIGGGTMGSAVAWALGIRGVRALVIEQFKHVHPFGSHGGATRQIRHAYAEGADYIPLVRRADDLWCALESEHGEQILFRTGMLEMGRPGLDTWVQASQSAADSHGIPYEMVDGAEIRRRWPAWAVDDDWYACFEPQSGYLAVEPALRILMKTARRFGATLHDNERVKEWAVDGEGVTVRTQNSLYRADRLIITAGAWANSLLADLGLPLTVLRKVLWWFAVEDSSLYTADRFPIFGIGSDPGSAYGIPLHAGSGLKLAEHGGGELTHPDHVNRMIMPSEHMTALPHLQRLLVGLTSRVLAASVCLYTMSPDEHFVIDRHPESPQVVFAAGFSGHGFKFAPAIGEHLASLSLDGSASSYPLFTLGRFHPA